MKSGEGEKGRITPQSATSDATGKVEADLIRDAQEPETQEPVLQIREKAEIPRNRPTTGITPNGGSKPGETRKYLSRPVRAR